VDNSLVWIALFLIFVAIMKGLREAREQQEVENLRNTNPQLYAQLKQIEHEQKMMEHDEKRMTHEKQKMGAGIVGSIFRAFWQ